MTKAELMAENERLRESLAVALEDSARLDSRQISIGGCWHTDVDVRAAIDKHRHAAREKGGAK